MLSMSNGQGFRAWRATLQTFIEDQTDKPTHDWSVQGFGMLRCYFGGDEYRLNVWDPALAVPNVSLVHDHPWSFRSWLFAGSLSNTRYRTVEDSYPHHPAVMQGQEGLYHWTHIKTGPGGGPLSTAKVESLYLVPNRTELYVVGDTYSQEAAEIHMTAFRAGTVTLNDRTDRNGENARVFWQAGTPWVDAKPRMATKDEVKRTLALALDQFKAK